MNTKPSGERQATASTLRVLSSRKATATTFTKPVASCHGNLNDPQRLHKVRLHKQPMCDPSPHPPSARSCKAAAAPKPDKRLARSTRKQEWMLQNTKITLNTEPQTATCSSTPQPFLSPKSSIACRCAMRRCLQLFTNMPMPLLNSFMRCSNQMSH